MMSGCAKYDVHASPQSGDLIGGHGRGKTAGAYTVVRGNEYQELVRKKNMNEKGPRSSGLHAKGLI